MKTWNIPVIWQNWGMMHIEAETLEEAISKAFDSEQLPEGNYIDDSLVIDEEGLEIHNPEEK